MCIRDSLHSTHATQEVQIQRRKDVLDRADHAAPANMSYIIPTKNTSALKDLQQIIKLGFDHADHLSEMCNGAKRF